MKYAVLHHVGGEGGDHFDLLVEREAGRGDLATWRVPSWPVWGGEEAVQLRDHRRAYLTYQGEVSGGRGSVVRVAEGEAEVEHGPRQCRIGLAGRTVVLEWMRDELWAVRVE